MTETTIPAALLGKWGKITEAATRGPWLSAGAEVETEWVMGPGYSGEGERMRIANLVLTVGKHEREKANAQFIAEARTAVPRLLAAVEAVLKLTGPDGEVHRDLDGNEETGLVRVVRCDVLREAITAALTGKEAGDER